VGWSIRSPFISWRSVRKHWPFAYPPSGDGNGGRFTPGVIPVLRLEKISHSGVGYEAELAVEEELKEKVAKRTDVVDMTNKDVKDLRPCNGSLPGNRHNIDLYHVDGYCLQCFNKILPVAKSKTA
jgi:hypothetical protein